MKVTALSDRIGAEIDGIDLSGSFDGQLVEVLRALLTTRHLLLFRAGDLPPEDQIRLVACFGHVVDEKGDAARHIFVSNSREDGVLQSGRPLLFHSDCTYTDPPLSVLSLYAMELPAQPSPTLFASGVDAAASLPASTRARLQGATGRFVIGWGGGYERYFEDTVAADAPRTDHLILYPDPVSGRTVLFFDELFCDRVLGWDRDESEAIRAEAHQFLYAPENIYVHEWQLGDLVVWNNVALQHGRRSLPEEGSRTLRRVVALHEQKEWTTWTAVQLVESKARAAAGLPTG